MSTRMAPHHEAGPGTLAARLAEGAAVLVVTTSPATAAPAGAASEGPFSGDPHDVGMWGGNAPAPGPDPIAGADCVVAVGAGISASARPFAGVLAVHPYHLYDRYDSTDKSASPGGRHPEGARRNAQGKTQLHRPAARVRPGGGVLRR